MKVQIERLETTFVVSPKQLLLNFECLQKAIVNCFTEWIQVLKTFDYTLIDHWLINSLGE